VVISKRGRRGQSIQEGKDRNSTYVKKTVRKRKDHLGRGDGREKKRGARERVLLLDSGSDREEKAHMLNSKNRDREGRAREGKEQCKYEVSAKRGLKKIVKTGVSQQHNRSRRNTSVRKAKKRLPA